MCALQGHQIIGRESLKLKMRVWRYKEKLTYIWKYENCVFSNESTTSTFVRRLYRRVYLTVAALVCYAKHLAHVFKDYEKCQVEGGQENS